MSDFLFNKTLVIGLGMIGGSFAGAIRANNLSKQIIAYDINQEPLDLSKREGLIDYWLSNLIDFADEFKEIDLVVLALNLSGYDQVFLDLSRVISKNSIVIDLGSVKNLDLKNKLKNFIPCHPICGSHNTGIANANPDLFVGKKFIICDDEGKPSSKKIVKLAKKIGSNPEFMDCAQHDEIFALVSHLPQFLSFLTKEFSPKNIDNEFLSKIFRLDGSDPKIWLDIFSCNQKNLERFYLEFFDNLQVNLQKFRQNENNLRIHLASLRASLLPIIKNNKLLNINIDFLKRDFAIIIVRFLITSSYLNIKKINEYERYSGEGFKDFTSVISILVVDDDQLIELIISSRGRFEELVDKIFNSQN